MEQTLPIVTIRSNVERQPKKQNSDAVARNEIGSMVEVFDRLERSDFCKGSTGWKATFDWLMSNDSNWVKVMEGNYDNRRSGKSLNINDEWNEPQPASKHDAVDDWERENQAMPQHTESEWK